MVPVIDAIAAAFSGSRPGIQERFQNSVDLIGTASKAAL